VGFLVVILTLALIGVVVAIVSAPLRRARSAEDAGLAREAFEHGGQAAAHHNAQSSGLAHTREDIEAAREAKYREIRDTELDFRTGKLSREDYETIDADLRAEAIEILNELEASEIPPRESSGSSADGSADE
jgi:hypothetical protein